MTGEVLRLPLAHNLAPAIDAAAANEAALLRIEAAARDDAARRIARDVLDVPGLDAGDALRFHKLSAAAIRAALEAAFAQGQAAGDRARRW